jgi:hypothetical protein
MLDSFKCAENYRHHEITVATWPMQDGCECSFSVQPPLEEGSSGNSVIRYDKTFSGEDEARQACLVRARHLIDEKLAESNSAAESASQSNP